MSPEEMEAEVTLYHNEITYYSEFHYITSLVKEFYENLEFYKFMQECILFDREEKRIQRYKLQLLIERCKTFYNR